MEGTLLLTNDDGIDAPGMAALVAATADLARRVVVVAPLIGWSGCGHVVTRHEPISIESRGVDRYAIGGAPADCVRLAIEHLLPEFDWIVSGVNAGGNLGTDVYHSGTVAAVREGAIRGRRGIAVSHYIARDRAIDWDRTARWTRSVLERLFAEPAEPGTFWNVNLPHPPPGATRPAIVECPLDVSPLPIAYRIENEGREAYYTGNYQQRVRRPGHDVAVCFEGQIAATRLHV